MTWILSYLRVDLIPRLTALVACALVLVAALYLRAEKSILISFCPQMVSVEDRYEWYLDALMLSIQNHRFKVAGLAADRLASLTLTRTISPQHDPLLLSNFLILGRYSYLIKMLESSHMLNGRGNYYGHYLKGEALLCLHEYAEARAEFITARSLADEQPDLLFGLAKANLALGNKQDADRFLKMISSHASTSWMNAYRALMALKTGDEKAASAIANEFVNLMSDSVNDYEAIPNLDFVSHCMADKGFKQQALLLARESEQIRNK